ncbi:MAG TPA: DUF1559 domain-containing protein [Gemmataceae bacterium]|nr:DUF1559 domain-containing protein [Gemmataceae bacterium]
MVRTSILAAIGALFVGLVAVPAAGAGDPPTRAELGKSVNNLKQIVLAFHNYESANAHFPNNVYSKDGKPLLSWRVLILPYIEEERVYKEFKLDEPWDSENNKKLLAKMPKLYAPVRGKAGEGETFYRGFAGKNAPFGPDRKQGARIADFTDGLSNTGLIFEAGEPVVWTKPDDLPFDEAKPLPKLGGMFDGEFHVALGDGSVIRCKKDADEKELKKLIMPADGFPVDFTKLKS